MISKQMRCQQSPRRISHSQPFLFSDKLTFFLPKFLICSSQSRQCWKLHADVPSGACAHHSTCGCWVIDRQKDGNLSMERGTQWLWTQIPLRVASTPHGSGLFFPAVVIFTDSGVRLQPFYWNAMEFTPQRKPFKTHFLYIFNWF